MIKSQHGSNPENRTSQLSLLLACLLFFSGFVFPALKLQVFSQSFALTGEDQPESSPLATVWALWGEASWSYSILIQQHTRPGQSSQLPAKHTWRANWRQWRNQHSYTVLILLSTIHCMINELDGRLPNPPIFFLRASLQREECPVTCILPADEWLGLLLTFSADSGWLEQLSRNHIHNYGHVNWACQRWIISVETVKYT